MLSACSAQKEHIAPTGVQIYRHSSYSRLLGTLDAIPSKAWNAEMGRIIPGLAATLVAAHCGALAAQAVDLPTNDYPTVARADYVFACMQVNGQTRETLERCSCSIDAIASILPYEKYEEAETIMGVRQRGGKAASMFNNPTFRAKVEDLKRSQVEAELRCF